MKVYFEEIQRFRQWWLWVILAIVAIAVIGVVVSIPDFLYSFSGVLSLGILGLTLVFFWRIRLRTVIDTDVIRVSFRPFVTRELLWQDVVEAEVVDYGFAGGWGLRLSSRYGTIYNTSGSMGLALTLSNGQKLCIGTQREEDLRRVLTAVKQEHDL